MVIQLILTLLFFSASGQQKLLLNKMNASFRVTYQKGEYIRFRLDSSQNFTSGIIQGFTDSTFIIHKTEINLSQIQSIDLRGKNFGPWNLRSSPGKFVVAGLALPLIDQFNNPGNTSVGILWAGSGLVASGIIIYLLLKKKFVPGGRNKIQIIGSE